MNSPPLTPEILEQCLDRVALAMERADDGGLAFLPVFQRLEAGLSELRSKDNALAAARARVKRRPDQTAVRSLKAHPGATRVIPLRRSAGGRSYAP